MQKAGIIPDIKENKPAIAYANACFLPSNCTTHGNVTDIHTERRETREITLAVVALISVSVGPLVPSVIQYQLKSYDDILNDKVQKMENEFTKQLNQIENQIAKLQEQELKLANALVNLVRITANLANRQQPFESLMISYSQQLMEQQIITTRRSIEDRKLI